MRRTVGIWSAAAIAVACGVIMSAQKMTTVHPGTGGSPHVKVEWSIDGAAVAIEYGRPAIKGRPEAQLMPPGKEWRTGADQATTITSDKPLKFGTLTVPAGTNTLNTVPGTAEWQLVVIKGVPKWGIPYAPGGDLGRVPMKVGKTAAPVEQLIISIDDTPAGATLRIEWGTTSATIPFTVG